MPKRFSNNVRRSNRERHAVYTSLEENCLGLQRDLFNSLIRQANNQREHVSNAYSINK